MYRVAATSTLWKTPKAFLAQLFLAIVSGDLGHASTPSCSPVDQADNGSGEVQKAVVVCYYVAGAMNQCVIGGSKVVMGLGSLVEGS